MLVGGIVPRSGPLAVLGKPEEQGINLAVDHINQEMGGMAGRNVSVQFEDTATDPETGREKAKKLAEQAGVDLLVGAVSGAVAASVANYAYTARVPFWTYGGSESITGKDCKPTTFRYVFSTSQDARAGAEWSVDNLGKNVWIHYADYSYGQSIREQWGNVMDAASTDVNVVDVTKTSIGTSDYSSYISQIQSSNADWVLMAVTGSDLIDFIKQANQFGLKGQKDLVSQNITLPIRQALGSDVVGVYGNIRYPVDSDAKSNQTFVKAFTDAYDGLPSEPAMVMYTSLLLHAQAANEAGSVATADVVPALEGLQADSPMGPVTMRECDHQAKRAYPMGVMTEPDTHDFPGYKILANRSADEVTEPCSETGCSMPSL